MKKGLTELVFILDKSGSMSGLTEDTIGGFNSMIEKQKQQEGDCLVSLVLFNQVSNVVYDRIDLNKIEKLTGNDYMPMGLTALIDALGSSIHHIGNIHKYARKEDVPEKTIFVITTDGMENASRNYSSDDVKAMVTRQREKYGWEFLFLGANIDAVETARTYGIRSDRAVRYHNDRRGVQLNYEVLERNISMMRENHVSASEPWECFQEIDEDYRSRKADKEDN